MNIREKNIKEKTSVRKKRSASRRNREMWITIGIFGGLFLSMIIYLCVSIKDTNQEELINNSFNSRQQLLAKENIRGNIYDREGEILATTVVNNDGGETRVYPYGSLYAHSIGYSTRGKTGVESFGNYYLINSNMTMTQKAGNELEGIKNYGNNIYTTFDTRLQSLASETLGAFRGAAIVTDVKTGEILAMVSKPDFDPNTISQDWEGYVNNKDSSVLLNRATQGLYPPGSVFKIVTALEYYRENRDSYTEYSYTCNGRIKRDNINIQCYHGTNHGKVDYETSFARSCNCSFTNMGLSLDRNSYSITASGLLFNKELPIDYSSAISTINVDSSISDEDMAQISFGQGKIAVTPILINMITCGIANKGVVMRPMEMTKAVDYNGNVIREWQPKVCCEICTEEESEVIKGIMRAVVENGNGEKLKSDYYTVAGKTGSADFNNNKLDSHAWFTGFAPVEDPEIAVTIIVEQVGTGGEYAVPFAKRIFDCYFGVM